MIEPRKRHWLGALTLAAGIHVALALLLLRPNAGAMAPGQGGLEVSYGLEGAALDAAPAAVPTETVPAEAVDDVIEPVEPLPETAEVVPPVMPEPMTEVPDPPPVEPEPLPVEPAEVVPVEPAPPEPLVAETVEPVETPSAEPETPPAPPVARPEERRPERTQVASPAPPQREPVSEAVGTARSNEGRVAAAAPAGGDPGAERDYLTLLRAWLERHKEYPRRARVRGQEGLVMIRLVIDRDGGVVASGIEEGSGYEALDEAAAEMVTRAEPLPPMPDEMPQAALEIVVPVSFALR